MARRSSWNTPNPVRAFMGSNENSCHVAIRKMALEQYHMATRHITIEDLRQAFVPPHLRHSLKEAYAVSANPYMNHTLDVPITLFDNYPDEYPMADSKMPLEATFAWDRNGSPEGFFTMYDQKAVIQHDAPPELVEKIQYVYDQVGRISFEFGLVQAVFHRLNQHGYCNTPQQMRFVWPAIRHIVDKAGMRELAKDLVDASSRAGDRARVPPEIAPYMVLSVNIINRTLLMDAVDTNEKREFKMKLNNPEYVMPSETGNPLVFRGLA